MYAGYTGGFADKFFRPARRIKGEKKKKMKKYFR